MSEETKKLTRKELYFLVLKKATEITKNKKLTTADLAQLIYEKTDLLITESFLLKVKNNVGGKLRKPYAQALADFAGIDIERINYCIPKNSPSFKKNKMDTTLETRLRQAYEDDIERLKKSLPVLFNYCLSKISIENEKIY